MTRTRTMIAAGTTSLAVVAGTVAAAASAGATASPSQAGASARTGFTPGAAGARRPVLPPRGKRWLRRGALRPAAGLRPRQRGPVRQCGDAGTRDAEPLTLRPGPVRPHGELRDRSTDGPRRSPGAGRSWWSRPPEGCARGARSPSSCATPASRRPSPTPTGRPRGGSARRTARSWSASRWAPCRGSRPTTRPRTRRRTTSDDGAEGDLGVGQRCPPVARRPRRHDDVLVAAAAAHLDLPGDLDAGQVRPPHRPDQARAARLPRGRPGGQGNAVDDPAAHRGGDRLGGGQFGPYPFSATGGVVDDAATVGYSLETRNADVRPGAGLRRSSHELAHQWFGDSVTPTHLAGHLAQRGLRDLRRVALGRAPRGPRRRAELDRQPGCTPPATRFWRRRRPTPAGRATSSTPPSTSAARWPCRRCASGSATARSSGSCAPGRPSTATATPTADFMRCARRSAANSSTASSTWLYQPRRPAGV